VRRRDSIRGLDESRTNKDNKEDQPAKGLTGDMAKTAGWGMLHPLVVALAENAPNAILILRKISDLLRSGSNETADKTSSKELKI